MTSSGGVSLSLEGRICVVTGACQGIGRGIAERLAIAGASILVLDRRPSEKCGVDLSKLGADSSFFTVDVSDFSSVSQIRDQILEKFGRIDILVNNAGIVVVAPFATMNCDQIESLFKTNVLGTLFCSLSFGSVMIRQRHGKIVNIASTDAEVSTTGHDSELGVQNVVAYASTKGAVLTFTKALAVEWGTYGINVNAVSPIVVETPMTKHLFLDVERRARLKKGLPLHRFPEVNDIADAVLFLCSDLADSVNGHILHVDCGYSAKSMRG